MVGGADRRCIVLCCAVLWPGAQEAGYCCRGTDGCNAVMRLTVQDELWAAVNRGDGAVVRQHLAPLRLTPTQVRAGYIRMYIPPTTCRVSIMLWRAWWGIDVT